MFVQKVWFYKVSTGWFELVREQSTKLWDVNVPGGFGAAGGGPGSTMGNVISMQCHTTSTQIHAHL